MRQEPIQLQELVEKDIHLSEEECRFLLNYPHKPIDLRPVLGQAGIWRARPEAYCGVISLPSGRAVHIEPKAAIGNLWHMLTYAHDLLDIYGPPVGLNTVKDLVESIVHIFAKRVHDLIRHGVLRDYQSRHENLTTLRGRLDVLGNIRKNLTSQHRLVCNFDEFTTDILENRILRYTLYQMLRAGSWHRRVWQLLNYAERSLTEVGLEPIDDYQFDDLHFTRLNEHYRTPLNLARMLLQMTVVTHRTGERRMLPLLLHMPTVFEPYLQRMLAERISGTGLLLRWEGHSTRLDQDRTVTLEPDIVINRDRLPVCLADAKYKTISHENEKQTARSGKPKNADIYQMLAYCVGYRVTDAVLIYPEAAPLHPIRVHRSGIEARIWRVGIDLTGDIEELKSAERRLGERIVEVVEGAYDEVTQVPQSA